MQMKRSNVRRSKDAAFGSKEKKRLIQLSVCICLFLIIILGRGSEVIEIRETGGRMLQVIQTDTDFIDAFSVLGESVSRGDSIFSAFLAFGEQLFGVQEDEPTAEPIYIYEGPAFLRAEQMLSKETTEESMLRILGKEISKIDSSQNVPDNEENPPLVDESNQSQEQNIQNNSTEQLKINIPTYDGPALPENATMEYHELGIKSTITPVLGEISSAFGYRIHPLTGESSFHTGVDIAADTGTPIAAFAAGKVEFIGESDAYGLYVQLDHGNGIKSFYCHCSELLLGKGKPVTAGQTVALVGDTGDTTGSHLHMELKKEGTLLNPLYYIETIN